MEALQQIAKEFLSILLTVAHKPGGKALDLRLESGCVHHPVLAVCMPQLLDYCWECCTDTTSQFNGSWYQTGNMWVTVYIKYHSLKYNGLLDTGMKQKMIMGKRELQRYVSQLQLRLLEQEAIWETHTLPLIKAPFMLDTVVLMSDRWQSASRYSNRGFVLLRHWMTEFMKHCTTSSNTLKPMHINFGYKLSLLNTLKPTTAWGLGNVYKAHICLETEGSYRT